jgi:hypothetical protein
MPKLVLSCLDSGLPALVHRNPAGRQTRPPICTLCTPPSGVHIPPKPIQQSAASRMAACISCFIQSLHQQRQAGVPTAPARGRQRLRGCEGVCGGVVRRLGPAGPPGPPRRRFSVQMINAATNRPAPAARAARRSGAQHMQNKTPPLPSPRAPRAAQPVGRPDWHQCRG